MPERPDDCASRSSSSAWCCLLASVVVAALMFPVVGGFGLVSNRASDVVANGSAQLLEGEVPGGVHDGRREGQHDRLAVLAAPVRGAHRQDRQHHEAGNRLDRGQAVRRSQRRGLEGHLDRAGRLRLRRRRHPRRLDHRAAVREELPAAGDRPDRRRKARGDRNHAGAQTARDPDGAHAGQDLHQI